MVKESVMDMTTTIGAGAALVNPWWLDFVHTATPVGSLILQVLGGSWLIMQMYYKWKKGH
jgi:hypothetical protein